MAENRTLCAPNRATGPNALSKTILYQENLKSKVFFEEKTGKILEAGREIEKPCVKNRKRSERFLRELLDSFGKMMYNTSQQSARYRIGVGHGRTSRGDSGALYLQSAVAGMNPGPPEASCFVSCREAVMINRSCATQHCEPCQAGNRAALSRTPRVPRVCRF